MPAQSWRFSPYCSSVWSMRRPRNATQIYIRRAAGTLNSSRTIVARLEAGTPYYAAMGSELRARGYPTASVANWRTPLHLSTVALLGIPLARLLFGMLGVTVLLAGIWALAPRGICHSLGGVQPRRCSHTSRVGACLGPVRRGVVWVVDRSIAGALRTTAMDCGGYLRRAGRVRARAGGTVRARMRSGSSGRSSTKRKPRLVRGRRRVSHLLCDPRAVRARA